MKFHQTFTSRNQDFSCKGIENLFFAQKGHFLSKEQRSYLP